MAKEKKNKQNKKIDSMKKELEFQEQMAMHTTIMGYILSIIGYFYAFSAISFIVQLFTNSVNINFMSSVIFILVFYFNSKYIAYRMSNLLKKA